MTYIIYLLLWILGAVYGGIQVYDLLASVDGYTYSENLGWFNFLVITCVSTLIVHQGLIYHSIHEIDDHNSQIRISLLLWFASRFEPFVRFFIFFTLLSVGGKTTALFMKFGGEFSFLQDAREFDFYLWSMALLFLLLFTWDLAAYFTTHRSRNFFAMTLLAWKHAFAGTNDQAQFAASDLLAFVFVMLLISVVYGWISLAWLNIISLLIFSYVLLISIRAFRLIFEWARSGPRGEK